MRKASCHNVAMYRSRGTIEMLLLKWVAIPVAALVVGYFLVGPFVPMILGMQKPIKSSAPKQLVEESTTPTYGEPEVDISSTRAGRSYRGTTIGEQPRHRRSAPK